MSSLLNDLLLLIIFLLDDVVEVLLWSLDSLDLVTSLLDFRFESMRGLDSSSPGIKNGRIKVTCWLSTLSRFSNHFLVLLSGLLFSLLSVGSKLIIYVHVVLKGFKITLNSFLFLCLRKMFWMLSLNLDFRFLVMMVMMGCTIAILPIKIRNNEFNLWVSFRDFIIVD